MKIEKIKNYNQKILAVLGTIAIIFALIALFSFIFFSISDYRRYNYDDDDSGILSEEKIEELQKENKREQVISYKTPKLIDTLNQVYMIPVSHKTLNEPEEIDTKTLALLSSSNDYNLESDQRYSRSYYGDFNNIIIYNQDTGTTKKLFDGRVNFNDIEVEYFSDDIFLLFTVAEKDTHKDGVINLRDLKSLYMYSIKEKTIKRIDKIGMDVYSYKFLNNSKDLIISFGVDKNDNGKYEEHNEPILLKRYSFKTNKLIDVIGEKTNAELQKVLEGTK